MRTHLLNGPVCGACRGSVLLSRSWRPSKRSGLFPFGGLRIGLRVRLCSVMSLRVASTSAVKRGAGCYSSPLSLSFSDARALVALLHRGEVALSDLHGLLELIFGAELNDLRARFHDRRVAWRHVVSIACVDDLFALGVLYPHPALQHVSVVRALAHVVGQTLEERRDVEVLVVGLEADVYVSPLGLLDDGLIRLDRYRHIFLGSPHRLASLYSAAQLLVPGLDGHLAGDLAVLHLQRRCGQYACPVRVLARLVERYAVLAYDLPFDVVFHLPVADVTQVLGDLFLTMQLKRRAWGVVLADQVRLGVIGVEASEQLDVALLVCAAQGLEVEGGLMLGHGAFLLRAGFG